MSSVATLSPESRYSKLSYLTCGVLIWFHIQAIAALWSFSWTNLFVAVFLYWVAIGLGISMGYHRLHTHRGFKTYRLFEYFLAVCGTLTLEGGPIFWVATHRAHHQHSDQELDPHTPRVNGFWAHLGWIIFGEAHHNDTVRMSKYAPDLAKDPFYTLADDLSLGAVDGARLRPPRGRRLGTGELGDLPPRRRRTALDLAGELGDAHVGTPPLCHEGRLAQHLVGRAC